MPRQRNRWPHHQQDRLAVFPDSLDATEAKIGATRKPRIVLFGTALHPSKAHSVYLRVGGVIPVLGVAGMLWAFSAGSG